MIATTLTVTLQRSELVDFSIPYYDYAGIQILIKKPTPNKNLFNFLTVFRYRSFFSVASSAISKASSIYHIH